MLVSLSGGLYRAAVRSHTRQQWSEDRGFCCDRTLSWGTDGLWWVTIVLRPLQALRTVQIDHGEGSQSMLIRLQGKEQENRLMVSHTDVRTHCVVNNCHLLTISLVDEFLGCM